MACLWEPHIDFDPYRAWDKYQVTFTDEELWWGGKQRFGMTFHDTKKIFIWMPYPCETPGLCPGLFDWEMGLVLTEKVLPGSSESDKLVWRLDRNLTNELSLNCP